MKSFTFVILTLLLIPVCSSGQTVWTLKDCMEYAWKNNLSVKQKQLEVEQCENNLLKSKLDFLPSLNAHIGHNLNWGRSVDLQNLEIIKNSLSQSTSASVSASVYLIDGLSKLYTLKNGQKDVEQAILEVESLKNDISIAILRSYLQILLANEILSAADSNFKSVYAQRDRTEMLVNAGSQPYTALLDIESQLSMERVQLVTAQNQLASNKLALLQLLDMPYDENFSIFIPEIEEKSEAYIPESTDGIYVEALSLPNIKSAETAVEKSELELKSAKGQYYPKISLSGSYGTFFSSSSYTPDGKTYPFFEQFRDNINPSLSIGLSIPIFNNWNVRTRVENARLAKKNSELNLQIRHQTLYKEIQTAVCEAETCYRKMIAAKTNATAMEESFRYVEEKFNIGVLNGTDYVVAKTNMFKARSEYIQAKYQFVFQKKIIDYYKGIPLTL